MGRKLVIGDIHGGLRALMQVLERATVTNEDALVFLGDYVDGWSESAQVIDYLVNLADNQSCVFIKGNHDVWLEDWLRSGNADATWQLHGGISTIHSYESVDDDTKRRHLEFLEKMKLYHVDDENKLFIHAGFTSMHGPEQEFYTSNFSWDRTLWEMAITMDKRIQKNSLLFPKRLKLFREIFIGHTPTLNYNSKIPMKGCNVWNIDTGAAFTGSLTILDITTKEYWQSDLVMNLYKEENGRN